MLVYWLLPRPQRLRFLLLASFGYLTWLDQWAPAGMLALSLLVYALAPRPDHVGVRRWSRLLVLSLLGYLAFFKYVPDLARRMSLDTFASSLAVPLGISYFTFKLIHYTVERGRGTFPPHSPSTFLAWLFLFPIFTGGPIERFEHFTRNIDARFDLDSAAVGVTRIAQGLIKRFLLAELLVGPPDAGAVLDSLGTLPAPAVYLFCCKTYLFAYLDFSALSDIAIGSSRLFGLRIMENFHWPILARNIGEFWKRWHMTLMAWCQAYIYMPLIGWTRKPALAAYATFLTMGLWHAGSLHWVGWGLYHATGVVIYQRWARFMRGRKLALRDQLAGRLLGIALTFVFVSGGSAFTSVWGVGSSYDSLRILARLVGLHLSALDLAG